MKKLFLILLLVFCVSVTASAWNPMVTVSGKGVSCATMTDGDYAQNFEGSYPPTNWTETDPSTVLSQQALLGSPAAKLCDNGVEIDLENDSAANYILYDAGSLLDGSCWRIYFNIHADTTGWGNQVDIDIIEGGASATEETDRAFNARLRFRTVEGWDLLIEFGEGGTNATTFILTQGTWHYVDVCVNADNTGGTVNFDGADYTGSFNPGDFDIRYLRIGSVGDRDANIPLRFQFDAVAYFVDADGDSPIGP